MSISKVLMVEGIEDKYVISRLMTRRKLNYVEENDQFIKNADGLPDLLKTLPVAIQFGDYDIIGIVIDADTDLDANWKKIKDVLKSVGYKKVPNDPQAEGLIIEAADLPKIGCWLMPDNQLPGNLEDFLASLVADGDPLLPIASAKVEELIAKKQNRFSVAKKSKAIIHTWLAWQERPGTRLGKALLTTYNKEPIMDDKKGIAFINWLQRLFRT